MLLSRTADHLYWHARYIERAENTARMLGVNYDTLLMPHEPQQEIDLWRATLGLSELEPQFLELYGEISTENVLRFMVTDQRNLSSIVSCLWAARENARAVRDSLTSEMWETVNDMWLESCQWVKSDRAITQVREYLDWIKLRHVWLYLFAKLRKIKQKKWLQNVALKNGWQNLFNVLVKIISLQSLFWLQPKPV